MKTRKMLTLDDVQAVAAAALKEAQANNWQVSIAIVDDGGHMLHFQRMDGAGLTTVGIAPGKARTAAMARRPTKAMEEIIKNGRHAFLSVDGLVMLEGGEPIIADGICIGAVGVSGVKSDDDARIARAGIAALGLPG